MKKQHWLILSHCFNMDGRAASQTITDKLPHLMGRGIEPIVLSGISGKLDRRFLHMQLLPWGPSGLRFDLRHVVAMHFGRGFVYRVLTLLITLLLAPFIVLERLLFGLQNHASWVFPAVFRSLLLIRRYRPAVIYTTGGAYSAHLAGYWLKKLTGLPWIAEIHDPLVIAGRPDNRNERFTAKLEGLICREADLVWWFTEGALARARQRHPELGERGMVVLPGAEPPQSDAVYCRSERMAICHFGSLSATRSATAFTSASQRWVCLPRLPPCRSMGCPIRNRNRECATEKPEAHLPHKPDYRYAATQTGTWHGWCSYYRALRKFQRNETARCRTHRRRRTTPRCAPASR